jgi:uncharacterized protein YkwD
MIGMLRVRLMVASCVAALALASCGGGHGNSSGSSSGERAGNAPPATQNGAPAVTGDIAVDGRNWINYRRGLIGIPMLTDNPQIDTAAQRHSDYQRINNTVSHTETAGLTGFFGVTLLDRLNAAGYFFAPANHAFGEVIAASTTRSGVFLAEELITAIYHRYVIFEPVFKEFGAGASTTPAGFTYFTTDFTANNGYGPGVGPANVAVWPFNGQTQVPANFFSDFETPDPVLGVNEVGYPISVHANITSNLAVEAFTVRPRGAANLSVRLLDILTDPETPHSAAAIIPLSPLAAGTTYDVTFAGSVDGAPVNRSWSFTTK